MFEIHDYSNFIVTAHSLVPELLEKLSTTKGRTIFVLDDNNHLLGSVTDGDLRRYLMKNQTVNISKLKVLELANVQPYSLELNTILELPRNLDVDCVPVVDHSGKLVFLLSKTKPIFKLGEFTINEKSAALIIAEIGNNHQGSIQIARKLITSAKQAGADIVKFQHRNLNELYSLDYNSFDLGSQYVRDLVAKYQLNKRDLFKCFDHCKEIGIAFTCTPFDHAALADLQDYGVPFYKIASADFLNDSLISAIIKTQKPFIISTGMANESDIQHQIKKIASQTEKFIPLHCNSAYPAPYKDLQMNFMDKIEKYGNGYVGYSGHEQGIAIAIACASRGVKVIEKHFTLDKALEGNDHKVSLVFEEFQSMVEGVRAVELAFSDEGSERLLSQGEIANKLALGKGLYFKNDMSVGQKCSGDILIAKSPVLGLPVEKLSSLVGRQLLVNAKAGEPVKRNHFFESEQFQNFSDKVNCYVPVRHADCDELIDALGAKMVEFHLSYSDLNLDPEALPWSKIINYSVHAPELFEEDSILDISCSDKTIWSKSVENLKRVVDYSLVLNEMANIVEPINLVVNVGGATDTSVALSAQEKLELYANVNRGLNEVLGPGVEHINICIQTMPPFPWHFGGRRFHNLFVEPDEIKNFCEKYGWGICLDTSHSMMACRHLSIDFEYFLSKIFEFVDHIHLADCVGVDGEGVETGKGDFNFRKFKTYYDSNFNGVPLVLEEWQGHMNRGVGFKNAVNYLQSLGYFK